MIEAYVLVHRTKRANGALERTSSPRDAGQRPRWDAPRYKSVLLLIRRESLSQHGCSGADKGALLEWIGDHPIGHRSKNPRGN